MNPDPTVVDNGAAASAVSPDNPNPDNPNPDNPNPDNPNPDSAARGGRHGLFGGESSPAPREQPPSDNGSLPLLLLFIAIIVAIGFGVSWWIPGCIAGLLVMLFMHELGHFVTARASGMKVTEFFLGFGPKIWSFNRGETEYGIKAIPAGAYVKILGMTNLDEIDPAEEHRTYRAQPYWQRMMTICAGSAMHFIMAAVGLVILFGAYSYQGFNGPPWFVSEVVDNSTASALGVERGDEIVSVNGETFSNWDEFGDVVGDLQEGPVEVVLERNGETLTRDGQLGLRPQDVLADGFGFSLFPHGADNEWVVRCVHADSQADEFGLQSGDIVESVDGIDSPSRAQVAEQLRQRDGGQISLVVVRSGESVALQGPVELTTSPPFRGFFGIGREYETRPDPGVGESVRLGVEDFGEIAKMNLIGLAELVNPLTWIGDNEPEPARRSQLCATGLPTPVSPTQVDGPDTNRPLSIVGIFRLISQSESADEVIFLLAVVNIFIGIFNLVPLLPLDGGHAAIATYERARGLVTRSPYRVDAAKLIPITWVVILLLVGVGIWTVTLDIFSWPA